MNNKICKVIRRYSKLAQEQGLEYDTRNDYKNPNVYKVNKRKYKKMNKFQRVKYINQIKTMIGKMQGAGA